MNAPRALIATLLLTAALSPARLHAALTDALAAGQILRDSGIESVFIAQSDPPAAAAVSSFGVLFVFENIVWHYAPETGTCILGQATGTEPDWPAALRPLFARFAPAGATLKLYRQSLPVGATELSQRPLRGACVIGCMLALTHVLAENDPPDEAGFVLFLFDTAGRADFRKVSPLDHSVLVYRRGKKWWSVDPREPNRTIALSEIVVGSNLDPVLAALAARTDHALQRSIYFPIAPATLRRLSDQLATRAARLPPP